MGRVQASKRACTRSGRARRAGLSHLPPSTIDGLGLTALVHRALASWFVLGPLLDQWRDLDAAVVMPDLSQEAREGHHLVTI
jgi:hypothetical protein